MHTFSWISKIDFMVLIKSISFQSNAKRWSIELYSQNMKDIQSFYNLYIINFYVSTIVNFPSPKLLAGLSHFLNNDFSYLACHVKFSRNWDANHLCPSSSSIRSFLMLSWTSFIMLWVSPSLCSMFIRKCFLAIHLGRPIRPFR